MIDTAKLNTEELGNIIVDVQNETGFWFDVDDMVAIMQHLYAQPLPERLPKRARPDAGDVLSFLRRADCPRRRVRRHRR